MPIFDIPFSLILAGLLAVGFVILIKLIAPGGRKRPANSTTHPAGGIKASQLDFVSDPQAVFSRKRLMNRGEYSVFQSLKHLLSRPEFAQKNLHVFPQVPGSVIFNVSGPGKAGKRAGDSIRYKVFDFVIINGSGYPLAVVEYNGEGHYQANSKMRDAVKKMACQRAGIAFIQIEGEQKPGDYLPGIARVLNAPASQRAYMGNG